MDSPSAPVMLLQLDRSTEVSHVSVFKTNLFLDQNIVVTGAERGIGRCTAHELASLGAHVVLIGRKREKLESVAGEIRAWAPLANMSEGSPK